MKSYIELWGHGSALRERVDGETRFVQLSNEQLQKIASNFQVIVVNGGFDPVDIEIMRYMNPDIKFIRYMNGSYTWKNYHCQYFEREDRTSISMFHACDLAQDIDASDDTIQLSNTGGKVPIKGSTIAGDISQNSTNYVSWILIDDEFMKVESVNYADEEITVSRGFDGTYVSSHEAGTPILTPVYIGSTGKWVGYPNCSKPFLRYALRPDHFLVWEKKANEVIDAVNDGYNGVMMDIMSAGFFNQCDGFGKQVTPWNFEKSQRYTHTDYREHQEKKVNALITITERILGEKPYIVGNTANQHYFENRGGSYYLLEPTPIKPIPLDGGISEGMFSIGIPGEERWRYKRWSEGVRIITHASQNNIPVIGISKTTNAANPIKIIGQYERFELFDYASFLLGYETDSSTKFLIPLFSKEEEVDTERLIEIMPYFFYDLGNPEPSVPHDNINQLQIEGHETFSRKYENGIVLVNPSEKYEHNIKLEKPCIDPESDRMVNFVDMPEHTAKILIRKKRRTRKI